MNRRSSSLGALHPVLFMLMIYVISVVLALFVCTTIYNSLHKTGMAVEKELAAPGEMTALR